MAVVGGCKRGPRLRKGEMILEKAWSGGGRLVVGIGWLWFHLSAHDVTFSLLRWDRMFVRPRASPIGRGQGGGVEEGFGPREGLGML